MIRRPPLPTFATDYSTETVNTNILMADHPPNQRFLKPREVPQRPGFQRLSTADSMASVLDMYYRPPSTRWPFWDDKD